ncbi:DUF4282 domain-containing protein [Nocardia carnea]|uniref:DUF4282 domain-containing protein n=1 Tax=Nocardia carnea TaxID=37328 RepID=UPI00245506B0|nr:DUF4282 domain-containing protein [Nocardia carnea]
MASESADESPRTGPAAAGAPGPAAEPAPDGGPDPEPPGEDITAEPAARRIRRKLPWRAGARAPWGAEAVAQRLVAADGADDGERRGAGGFRRWAGEAVGGLLDIQFRRPATRTLLPLVYLLGLAFAVAAPIVVTVLAWGVSALLGVLAAVFAIPLAVTIAAAVRLLLEFLVNASRLATRVEHISDMADDLFQVLSEVAEPMSQLSEDVRAVQFWRFRRGSRK